MTTSNSDPYGKPSDTRVDMLPQVLRRPAPTAEQTTRASWLRLAKTLSVLGLCHKVRGFTTVGDALILSLRKIASLEAERDTLREQLLLMSQENDHMRRQLADSEGWSEEPTVQKAAPVQVAARATRTDMHRVQGGGQ